MRAFTEEKKSCGFEIDVFEMLEFCTVKSFTSFKLLRKTISMKNYEKNFEKFAEICNLKPKKL